MAHNITVQTVPPARLDRDTGDIANAYSADTIADSNRIRKPFNWHGGFYVTVANHGDEFEAYRLLDTRDFVGLTTTYNEKVGSPEGAEAARNDPNGFYHGMAVKSAGKTLILSGPPVLFVPGADTDHPAQLTLF